MSVSVPVALEESDMSLPAQTAVSPVMAPATGFVLTVNVAEPSVVTAGLQVPLTMHR